MASTETDIPQKSDQKKTSKHRGVSWNAASERWVAQTKIAGIQKYLGSFTDEDAAARMYDFHQLKLGRKKKTLNFPDDVRTTDINSETAAAEPEPEPSVKEKKKSKHKGVSWNCSSQKWVVQIKIDGKQSYLGSFDCEVDAANKYDNEAAKLGRKLNFPENKVSDAMIRENERNKRAARELREKSREKRKSSRKGVTWNFAAQKWVAQAKVDRVQVYLGIYDTEEEAGDIFDKYMEQQTPRKSAKTSSSFSPSSARTTPSPPPTTTEASPTSAVSANQEMPAVSNGSSAIPNVNDMQVTPLVDTNNMQQEGDISLVNNHTNWSEGVLTKHVANHVVNNPYSSMSIPQHPVQPSTQESLSRSIPVAPHANIQVIPKQQFSSNPDGEEIQAAIPTYEPISEAYV